MLTAPPPKLVFWESTAGCNLACRHCRRLEAAAALSRRDLTTEQVRRYLLDGLVAAASGGRTTALGPAAVGPTVLVCSGGEPLLRPDLFDLAHDATARGLSIALATNGTLVDDAMSGRIVAAGFERVAVSLDGADAATHDDFRQQPGAFEAALAGIGRLQRRGMPMQVNTTVTQHNVGQLDALYERLAAMKVAAWHVFMFVPVGCGLTIPAEQQLAAAQYEQVLQWLSAKALERRVFVRATCAPQYYRVMAQTHALATFRHGAKFATMTKGCLAGTGICFVSHTGEVFPCGYLPISAGNICRTPFAELWAEAPLWRALRDPQALEGKCGVCEFKHLCSGCRARAYAATGNYLAEEPCCAYVPRARSTNAVSA